MKNKRQLIKEEKEKNENLLNSTSSNDVEYVQELVEIEPFNIPKFTI